VALDDSNRCKETQLKKGKTMNYTKTILGIIGIAAGAICGCVHRTVEVGDSAMSEGGSIYQHCKCEHVHIRSVLGIMDEVLADTNRFPLGAMRYGVDVKLDKPILGCTDARFDFDEMDQSRRSDVQKMPHRLRNVELKRVLPDDATADTLLREAKSVIDEIAGWLDVEPPEIELVDVGEWRNEFGSFLVIDRVRTNICFDLADEQKIIVHLLEGGYVIRDGRAILVNPPQIEVNIAYNYELFNVGVACCRQESTNDTVKVEKELDIGDDCADKLAKANRREIDEHAARRKKSTKPKP